MDSVDKISAQISEYTAAGRPSDGLKVAELHYTDADCAKSLIFCMAAAHAAVRSQQPHGIRRRLLVRYLTLIAKSPEYHKDIERNFWYTQAAVAVEQKKPVVALMMYAWVLELNPDRRLTDIVDAYIRKIQTQYPKAVVRAKLTREELVGPRHRQ